jgi:hypothetical protein
LHHVSGAKDATTGKGVRGIARRALVGAHFLTELIVYAAHSLRCEILLATADIVLAYAFAAAPSVQL